MWGPKNFRVRCAFRVSSSGPCHSVCSVVELPVLGLMMALVLVQVVCPMLFVNGIQWWVSGGVVLGYGSVLFSQLLRQRTHNGL